MNNLVEIAFDFILRNKEAAIFFGLAGLMVSTMEVVLNPNVVNTMTDMERSNYIRSVYTSNTSRAVLTGLFWPVAIPYFAYRGIIVPSCKN